MALFCMRVVLQYNSVYRLFLLEDLVFVFLGGRNCLNWVVHFRVFSSGIPYNHTHNDIKWRSGLGRQGAFSPLECYDVLGADKVRSTNRRKHQHREKQTNKNVHRQARHSSRHIQQQMVRRTSPKEGSGIESQIRTWWKARIFAKKTFVV